MAVVFKPCPFCGHKPPEDLVDTLYKTGQAWYTIKDGVRGYFTPGWDVAQVNLVPEGYVWKFLCNRLDGGCNAETIGDSREEAIAAWNRRPSEPYVPTYQARIVKMHHASRTVTLQGWSNFPPNRFDSGNVVDMKFVREE